MNQFGLLFGVLPLLIFVIVDSFSSLKWALISAILMAILEVACSIYLFHQIDEVSVFSLVLVIVLAFITYKKQSRYFIKIQPVILSFVTGIYLLITYFLDHPLFLEMMTKYQSFLPENAQNMLTNPLFIKLLEINTLTVGIALIIHALITYWAAVKLNNWWWIAIKGIGFYILTFIAMLIGKILV